MKFEKMTDAELEGELSLCGNLHTARRIQIHIATLTMERDEAIRRGQADYNALHDAAVRGMTALITERDEARAALEPLRVSTEAGNREIIALRERVQAMERILATEEQERIRHRDDEAELGDHLATRNSTGQRFDFPTALYMLKADVPVRRAGWNGKGMRLERVSPMSTADAPYLALIATDGKRYPWVPSQQDMFANDYEMVMP